MLHENISQIAGADAQLVPAPSCACCRAARAARTRRVAALRRLQPLDSRDLARRLRADRRPFLRRLFSLFG
jgi:antitoxin (DNA-binding transcriptional repressor) of toxin-antitoxin stability system